MVEGVRPRRVLYSLEDTDEAVLRRFVQGKTQYIGQLELLWGRQRIILQPRMSNIREAEHRGLALHHTERSLKRKENDSHVSRDARFPCARNRGCEVVRLL